jgi:hypothetical protein
VKNLEQLPDPPLGDERMAKGQLRLDLVDVSPPASLAMHIPLVDELGEDPVSASLGDPHSGGDVSQADARIARDADQDMGMPGEEVPVRAPAVGSRGIIHRSSFHETSVH